MRSDRMWDVRLSEKEEELKKIQLEKAQNESHLSLKMTRLSKQLNEYMASYKRARSILKSKEELNRELRARMAQRDIQWKTAFRNKQIEVKNLAYELQLAKRGFIARFVGSFTGADKKNRNLREMHMSDSKNTSDMIN